MVVVVMVRVVMLLVVVVRVVLVVVVVEEVVVVVDGRVWEKGRRLYQLYSSIAAETKAIDQGLLHALKRTKRSREGRRKKKCVAS